MCGIVGAMDLTGQREFPKEKLIAMTHAILHRGPDDEHFYEEPGLALGVRRLAIVDLSHGRQPISNHAKNIWVAFNGELFDYPEMRANLELQGHTMQTHCDTEAWIHLYEKYREKMFEHARGQFAVALWDRNERTLFLGRDRVGICPLYYTVADGWLLWASEIKSLIASKLIILEPDVKGIDYLFNFFCSGAIRTFFKDISLVSPGHYLKIKNGEIKKIQYWDLNFPNCGDERIVENPNILIDELDGLLKNAVKKRLRCDVSVASYVSGGVDSSVILGLGSQFNKKSFSAFTIGFDRIGHDERSKSEETARHFNTDLTSLHINSAMLLNQFPELIYAAEGPMLDTSCSALMQLATLVHQKGYKVVLTGEGADEAFGGYFCFKAQKISETFKNFLGGDLSKMTRHLTQWAVHSNSKNYLHDASVVLGSARPAQQFLFDTVGLVRHGIYSDAMWTQLEGHNPYSDLQLTNKRLADWHPLNQSLYVGYKVMLPGLLMSSKGDRIAMHSSVETRYPYLDEDVIAFSATLHPKYKLRGFTDKWLLRQVAKKMLPAHIAKRRKVSFSTKLSSIFLGASQPAWVRQLLSHESLKKSGYFDPIGVTRAVNYLTKYPRVTPRHFVLDAVMTSVITTQLWHHVFFGGLCELPCNDY